MTNGIPDVALIIAVGTVLFLLLGTFIAFMTLTYQKKRLQHQREMSGLVEAYQKEMLKAQLEMQEQTFLSISQEIHDNVGQILSLVRLHMSTLSVTEDTAARKITTSKELLDQAIQDLRNLSKRLNSKYVAQQSLGKLLGFQLDLIQKTGAVLTSFAVTGEERSLNEEKKLFLFRIAQEALNNILKHADASTITVELRYAAERMTLSITDDGKGFPVEATSSKYTLSHGTGTHNMYYRAGLIGATLCIQGKPAAGTTVFLELPFKS